MAETVVLDPSEVATGRTQIDVTSFVQADGVDWGDAAFEAYMAQALHGSVPVDGRLPNRVVTVPLTLRTVGATSFSTIRRQLQAKVALFQRQGGWMKRQVDSTPVFLDVVNASLRLGGAWTQARATSAFDADGVLTLECTPDFYGAEVDLGLLSETTNAELVGTYASVTGDLSARTRIVVTDAQGQAQAGLLWAFRQRHYSSATTAKVAYAATALTPLDLAAVSGSDVTHANLATSWTPVLGTNTSGSYLTHTGTYRVWANVASPNGAAVSVRFVWDVGDLTLPVQNDPVTVPGLAGPYMLDLGEIRLDPAPVGTHRWQGAIQAKGTVGGEDVSVRRVWFQPVDDGCGRLRAPADTSVGLAGYVARDEFNQAPGVLTGKTLPVGGTWAFLGGDADDFNVNNGRVQRATVSDTAYRAMAAGASTYTAIAARVDLHLATANSFVSGGLMLRWVDGNNNLQVNFSGYNASTGMVNFGATAFVAGVQNSLFGGQVAFPLATDVTLTAQVDTGGRVTVSFGTYKFAGQHSSLATGGALASGRVGFFDYNSGATAATREFDNFAAWVPVSDAVIFASRSAELRWDGMVRQDSTGTSYGPISHVIGGLPRIPPAGLEGRTTEVFVKASRGDLDQLPDGGNADDLQVRVYARPSWLFTPA